MINKKQPIPVLSSKDRKTVVTDEVWHRWYPQESIFSGNIPRTPKFLDRFPTLNVEYITHYNSNKHPMKSSVIVRCKTCGVYFCKSITYLTYTHESKNKQPHVINICPYCRIVNAYFKKYKRVLAAHDMELLGVYSGTYKTLKFRCKRCNYVWDGAITPWCSMGKICPNCKYDRRKNQKTNKIIRHTINHSGVPVSTQSKQETSYQQLKTAFLANGVQVNTSTTNSNLLMFKCMRCHHTWEGSLKYYQQQNSYICPNCKSKTVNTFEQEKVKDTVRQTIMYSLKNIYGNRYSLLDYSNKNSQVLIHCNNCDNEWLTDIQLLLHGLGCPKCSKNFVA